jgi:hypothetical protein
MFGHFKGPPQQILNAFYWSRVSIALGVSGALIYAGVLGYHLSGARVPAQQGNLVVRLLGLGAWFGTVMVGLLFWYAAGQEVSYARRQLQREAMASVNGGDPRAATAAVGGLSSSDWLTRQNASAAFTRLETPAVAKGLPELIRAIESGETLVASNAAKAVGRLGSQGEPAIGALLDALAVEAISIRVAASQALNAIGEPALLRLGNRLDSVDPQERHQAVCALKYFDSKPEAALLWQLRHSPQRPPKIVIGRLKSAGWSAYEAV